MPSKVVNMQDLAKELGAYSEKHIAELKQATLLGIARSVPDLVAASPVDTGLYAASWDFSETEFGAVLGNTAPHAAFIEYGTRAGTWVPIRPLLQWAKRVLQDPSQPPDYSSAVWGLAKYTQQKIHDQGQMPKHIMLNMIPRIIDYIKAEYLKRGE
jgi:hypothetical protein